MMQAFEDLERQKAKLLAQVSASPAEFLTFRPQPASWSVLQVLEHLVKVETAFHDSVRQNLSNGHAVGWRDRAGALMVNIVMRSPMRIKTPGTVAAIVTPDATGDLQLSRTVGNRPDLECVRWPKICRQLKASWVCSAIPSLDG